MPYEPKDGSGTLFQNQKKSERGPDYRGEVMISGTVYELAGWKKQTKAGDTFLSLAAKPKEERKETRKPVLPDDKQEDMDVPF